MAACTWGAPATLVSIWPAAQLNSVVNGPLCVETRTSTEGRLPARSGHSHRSESNLLQYALRRNVYITRRHQWAVLQYMTFLIGTGANIVLGAIAYTIAKGVALYS